MNSLKLALQEVFPRITGEVSNFSTVLCIGKIRAHDGQEYFVHKDDAPIISSEIRGLIPGQRVNFTPASKNGKLVAEGVELRSGSGHTPCRFRSGPQLGTTKGYIKIMVTDWARVTPFCQEHPSGGYRRYEFETSTFFPITGKVDGFNVINKYGEGSVLLLDEKKNILGAKGNLKPKEIILLVSKDGGVIIWRIGRRHERVNGTDVNYMVIEERLNVTLSGRSEQEIASELRQSGRPLAEYDAEFAKAIAQGFENLKRS